MNWVLVSLSASLAVAEQVTREVVFGGSGVMVTESTYGVELDMALVPVSVEVTNPSSTVAVQASTSPGIASFEVRITVLPAPRARPVVAFSQV